MTVPPRDATGNHSLIDDTPSTCLLVGRLLESGPLVTP